MGNTPTPIYGFPQFADGDHGWGPAVDAAFVAIENLISALAAGAVGEEQRAETAELALQEALATEVTERVAAVLPPLNWGDVAGTKTWQWIYDSVPTWADAQSYTWGSLTATRSWGDILNSGKTWQDAFNYTWDAL